MIISRRSEHLTISFGCDAWKVQESRSGSAGRMQYRKQTDRSASEGIPRIGADVDIEHGKIVAEAEHLRGTHLYFDVVSVGATINVMMAATMADGLTIMENVAKEPHVVDVANFLNSMGANIRGAGTDVIKIRGSKSLHKTEYSIIPDQIEAVLLCLLQQRQRNVTVVNVIPKHLDATISKLVDIGCEVEEFDDAVRVVAKNRLRSTQVKTLPYPGYPTDMQPQIGVVLALAQGASTITESIFENRFKYLDELARMGAVIKVEGNSATIEGVEKFSGARVSAPDLRARCGALYRRACDRRNHYCG